MKENPILRHDDDDNPMVVLTNLFDIAAFTAEKHAPCLSAKISNPLNPHRVAYFYLLLSGKKRQNHIFSTNIISYTCFTKKGLSFEAM